MRESEIEKKVCDYARTHGWLSRKWSSPGQNGVPDRLFFGPEGRLLIVEFKATGQTPTKLQSKEIGRLRDLGHFVEVIDDVEQGKRLLDAYSL